MKTRIFKGILLMTIAAITLQSCAGHKKAAKCCNDINRKAQSR